MTAPAPQPLWKRLGLSTLRIALGVLVLLQVYMYLAQDGMIFMAQPLDDEIRNAVRRSRPDAEEITITTADGAQLRGWFVRNGKASTAPALIYFGGNAEEVSGLALDADELRGISLVLINYRGYGKSSGTPSESVLFSDALTIYDYVAAKTGVDKRRIVAMGRSLGSGVATYLATQRPLAAVVLVTPYDSMTAVARAKYPIVLVDLILKHPFDSVGRAPAINAPLLALIAGADTVIPPRHAARLTAAWYGPATSITLKEADHNDIEVHPGYWASVREFLKKIGIFGEQPGKKS